MTAGRRLPTVRRCTSSTRATCRWTSSSTCRSRGWPWCKTASMQLHQRWPGLVRTSSLWLNPNHACMQHCNNSIVCSYRTTDAAVDLQTRSDATPSDAGIGAAGSLISGGTSTPHFAARGRRTPRNRAVDADTTPNSKVSRSINYGSPCSTSALAGACKRHKSTVGQLMRMQHVSDSSPVCTAAGRAPRRQRAGDSQRQASACSSHGGRRRMGQPAHRAGPRARPGGGAHLVRQEAPRADSFVQRRRQRNTQVMLPMLLDGIVSCVSCAEDHWVSLHRISTS